MNDLHEYHIASGTWKDLSSPRTTLAHRYLMGFAASASKLYVYGGYSPSSGIVPTFPAIPDPRPHDCPFLAIHISDHPPHPIILLYQRLRPCVCLICM